MLKKILKIFWLLVMSFMLLFSITMHFYPNQLSNVLGFRFYVVLTDSMEPVIPTFSVVFTKMIDEEESIDPNTIVTFEANRLGEDVLLTHYFRETQVKDDITYYRTQGATAPEYDNYETIRSDIIGKYVFHVPYIGKVILFLQSPFGYVMYGELAVVFLVNRLIAAKWEEKEKNKESTDGKTKKAKHKTKKTPFEIYDLEVVEEDGIRKIAGKLQHHFKQPVHYVTATIILYNDAHEVMKEERWYLVGKAFLEKDTELPFEYILYEDATDFELHIKKYKQS